MTDTTYASPHSKPGSYNMSSDSPLSPAGQSATRTRRAWSSGRVLSTAQRDRKRAIDRINKSKQRTQQSETIDKLKAQIELLSTKIHALEQRQPSTEVPQIIGSNGAVTTPPCASVTPTPLTSESGLPRALGQGLDLQYFSVPVSEVGNHTANSTLMDCHSRGDQGLVQVAALPSERATTGSSVTGVRPVVIQDLFSELVRRGCASERRFVCSDQLLNDDALIRGVTLGWHTVDLLCPLWEITSLLDQHIFGHSSMMTRFCTLRTTLFVLLYMTGAIDPQQLPAWIRPRPSQACFKHEEAIDMLPWSGLRERAVLCHGMTRSNRFWREVIHLFEFNWPYTTEMPYEFDPSFNIYRFTGAYENRVRDIRCWNMHPQFFKSFPDTFNDIVPSNFVAPLYTQLGFCTMLEDTMDGTHADGQALSSEFAARLGHVVGCHWPTE